MKNKICANPKCGHEHRVGKSGEIAKFCIKMDYCTCKKFESQEFDREITPEVLVRRAWNPKNHSPQEEKESLDSGRPGSNPGSEDTLSSKIIEDNGYYKFGFIQVEDIKEFIKKLKALRCKCKTDVQGYCYSCIEIDKLAGKDLI